MSRASGLFRSVQHKNLYFKFLSRNFAISNTCSQDLHPARSTAHKETATEPLLAQLLSQEKPQNWEVQQVPPWLRHLRQLCFFSSKMHVNVFPFPQPPQPMHPTEAITLSEPICFFACLRPHCSQITPIDSDILAKHEARWYAATSQAGFCCSNNAS